VKEKKCHTLMLLALAIGTRRKMENPSLYHHHRHHHYYNGVMFSPPPSAPPPPPTSINVGVAFDFPQCLFLNCKVEVNYKFSTEGVFPLFLLCHIGINGFFADSLFLFHVG
jgi:hypothetical protein